MRLPAIALSRRPESGSRALPQCVALPYTAAVRLGTNDCLQCGACCCNAQQNEREGVHHWVEIEDKAILWRRKDLVKRLVVYDEEKRPHLKLTPTGECVALRGKVGRSVRCSVYHHRPNPCRRVMPGDPECLRARVERL